MDKMLRKGSTIAFFITPALFLYSAIVFIPIIASIYLSFFDWDVLNPMKFIGLDNYTRMFSDDDVFFVTIRNVLFLLVTSLVIQLPFGFFLALILTGNVRGKDFFKLVFIMPAFLSSVAVGMMWTFIYHPQIGIINNLLDWLGLDSLKHLWLSEPKTVMWAVTAVVSWQFIGYTMILFIAAIQNISEEIFEAARLEGAIGWKLVWHITMPLLKPIIKVNTILISIGSLRFFDLVYVMTGGGPANVSQTLVGYLQKRSFGQLEYGYGNSLAVILLVMCLIVTFVINKIISTKDIED
ncbi:raffinose/stachyose/melibiose transport system permease protein [Paenibacillus sp. V4I3]|uniref:carbohydrate ABC transporter permease n=1 Tax=unclassified Paenibacillus TaxID=185978 RepID=UPI0027881B4B|nr:MULTISPECIES: sugar ABC transporter permease [unclassified Paenibacillus]MDQ0878182.1 raffinose/stachyose/melibiose transport system permease protein [Paenibacillus sp. V4I3]MDQ0885992.1 raffinose/stachyose/melibiose transport system permease protein [Paenibacillus sp. V4I9]